MYYKVICEVNEVRPHPEFNYVLYLLDRDNNTMDRLSCESYECPDLANRACRRLNLAIKADLRQS